MFILFVLDAFHSWSERPVLNINLPFFVIKPTNLLYKCNYFINYSQLMRCLDKEYMYEKYCNITIETCNCIQNNILYNKPKNDSK